MELFSVYSAVTIAKLACNAPDASIRSAAVAAAGAIVAAAVAYKLPVILALSPSLVNPDVHIVLPSPIGVSTVCDRS